MITLQEALRLSGQAKHTDPVIKKNNSVYDTFNWIKSQVPVTAYQTKGFANTFGTRGQTPLREISQNIFNFIKQNVPYQKDHPDFEQVRTPQRLLQDAQKGIGSDCDCYSMFILSILYNLQIPAKLKMVKLNGNNDYQHIYVIVPDKTAPKGYWIIDPVLQSFNQEATGVSGIFQEGIGCVDCNSLNGITLTSSSNDFDLLPNRNNIEPLKGYAI